MAIHAFVWAVLIILPIQVAGARLTESSHEASILFAACSNGFGIAIAIMIFRRNRAAAR
jgi:hypothetical protein